MSNCENRTYTVEDIAKMLNIGRTSAYNLTMVKMFHMMPETIVAVATFGNQAVNVRIPFGVAPKGMQNHNETGSEIFRFIHFEKHM